MRIVHILTRLLRAGSEENTLLTCAGQIERGHQVFLLHGHESIPEYYKQVLPDLHLIPVPALTREVRPFQDVSAYRQTKSILRHLSPDVVHTHQSKAGIVGRFAASSVGVPLIVHGVHILPFLGESRLKRTAYLAAERSAARKTDAYIHVSEGMKDSCLEYGVGTDRPHYVVRSGFDLKRFSNASWPDDWREILEVGENKDKPPVILMLSALEPRKNHLSLLNNLHPVLDRFPNVRVVFAGEGHMREEIAKKISAMGLQTQVKLLGYRDDPEKIIALSDVCVHCSDREGLPRSVLQYLAAGRPVVLFHLPGIDEIIENGQSGMIVPHGDWASLIEALGMVLSDPSVRAKLASGALDTDLGRWDSSLMAKETLAVYSENTPDKSLQSAQA